MKVKFFVSFLLFMLFTSSQVKAVRTSEAKDIPVREKGSHIGTRTSELSVTASLEQGLLTINVSHYIGIAKVYVYDANDRLVASTSLIVDDKGLSTLDLSTLENGTYEITVVFDDIVYVGTFEF